MTPLLEKIIAVALLCCMALFWFAIAPASISSREAAAISTPSPTVTDAQQETEIRENLEEARRAKAKKKAKKTYETRMARIERLKQRRRDTPVEGRARMVIGFEGKPAQRGDDRNALTRFEDIPDLPIAY